MLGFHGAEVAREEVWETNQPASWDPESLDRVLHILYNSLN